MMFRRLCVQEISIPPRKVSRIGRYPVHSPAGRYFHSTKEGFKVRGTAWEWGKENRFPFHQGRFQGAFLGKTFGDDCLFPFHQGRFQGQLLVSDLGPFVGFPFHQGRFQGPPTHLRPHENPLFPFHQGGFKADQQRRHPCLFSIAHRSPRSPCRVKRLRAPASKRLCSSPKRASTPRPFRAIGGRRTAYKDILQKYKTCYGVVKVQKVLGRVTPQNPYCRAPPPRPRGTCSARYAKHKTKHCRIASPKFYGRPP